MRNGYHIGAPQTRVVTTVAEVSAPPPSPTSPEPTSTKKRERDSNSGWYRVPTTTAVPSAAAGTPKECKRERDSEIGW
ncbi:hypothetical protein HZH68_000278 [Vespula germanica]|uniref:Uncharacterized protein n=1 Tax=Vespula germanica TaxID=30212 RepID=A0A834NT96_VESGE|nr:hypothetical protein HZH68_000278 [Vespula germanica]